MFHPVVKRLPGEIGANINTLLYGTAQEAHAIAEQAFTAMQMILEADRAYAGYPTATGERAGDGIRSDGEREKHIDGISAQTLPGAVSDGQSTNSGLETEIQSGVVEKWTLS